MYGMPTIAANCLVSFIVNVVPGFNCKKGPVLQSIPVSYSFPETLKLLRIVTP